MNGGLDFLLVIVALLLVAVAIDPGYAGSWVAEFIDAVNRGEK